MSSQATQDERELADLAEPDGYGQCGTDRVPEGRHHAQGDERFPHQHDGQASQHEQRLPQQECGVEQHPDGHEKENGERVAEGQRIGAGLMAERRLPDDHAGENGSQRHRGPEEQADPVATASAS